MPTALISLGSNLGDRQQTLVGALERVSESQRVRVVAASRWYATDPAGGPAGQGEFLNGAALLETSLSPGELLAELQRIEQDGGRLRHERWDARTLDLDILLFDDQIIDSLDLVIPHPRMTFRRFVLEPAAEIAGTMCHPTSGRTIHGLLANIDRRPRYVALAGGSPEKKRKLAEMLAAKCDGMLISDPTMKQNSSIDESLDQFKSCASLLRESNLDLQKTSISTFWIVEKLRDIARTYDDADKLRFAEALQRRLAWMAKPTLLVVLVDSDVDYIKRPKGKTDPIYLPAVLRLDVSDWPTIEQESIAAVLAM